MSSGRALTGGLMVCGTTSDAGKTTLVTGLCRLLARRGTTVAPFKAQNMALNSAVTPTGHEIGRAQAAQAAAAGVVPEVAMNPILLKPSSDRTCQVVVNGKPWKTLDAAAYQRAKPELLDLVLDSLAGLRRRFEVVLCEGAGSPAEINLLAADIVNLRIAREASLPAVVVGDIDRGGVFAAFYGTVALLPDDLRALVRGFVINKFRGDRALLADGPAELHRRCGVPTLGVIPMLTGIGMDAEDSVALVDWDRRRPGAGAAALDVAAVRFPRMANVTDLDALVMEDDVSVRLVDHPGALGRPDLVILPGTKATVADLAWLRECGLADSITALVTGPGGPAHPMVIGICGGYQMLGRCIDDHVESRHPAVVEGLGLLPVRTVFHPVKVTRAVTGCALGQPVAGYQIHHGRTEAVDPWMDLGGVPEGSAAAKGSVLGTSVHGLFDSDPFRTTLLSDVARRAGKQWRPSGRSLATMRQARFDLLADALEAHLDLPAVEDLIAGAGSPLLGAGE